MRVTIARHMSPMSAKMRTPPMKGADTVIGTAGFPGMDDETRRGEVGYDVARAH